MYVAQVVRVLIASPSDVEAERDAIERSIHDWNALNSQATSTVLLPVRWETDTYPALGDRPQGIINSQIADDCDMLIGCFWTRIGSPTGAAISGSVEEMELLAAKARPVHLYFSNRPTEPSLLDPDQLAAVRAFKAEMHSRGITKDFTTLEELRYNLLADLTRRVRESFAGVLEVQQSSPPQPNLANGLNVYRTHLLGVVAGFKSRWGSAKKDLVAANWPLLAQELEADLVEVQASVAMFLDDSDAALVKDLRGLSGMAHSLGTHQFYLDGGTSHHAFIELMDKLLSLLDDLAANDWGAYVVTQLPT